MLNYEQFATLLLEDDDGAEMAVIRGTVGPNPVNIVVAHAQRRVTVVCLFVWLSVCLSVTTLQASVVDRTLKFRHQ